MSGPIIRKLKVEDEEAWRELWTGYLDFYETSVSQMVYRTTFARLLAGTSGVDNEYRCLVAEQDGRLIGLVHFLFHRHCWRLDNVCYVQDLFVDPQARGGGIGRALIEAVYQAADAQGCPSVYWLTQEFNSSARILYDKLASKTPFIKYQR